jgi:hypothetical protein
VETLEAVLDGPDQAEAMGVIRSMVDQVELRPRADGPGLAAVLHGDRTATPAAYRVGPVPERKNSPALGGVGEFWEGWLRGQDTSVVCSCVRECLACTPVDFLPRMTPELSEWSKMLAGDLKTAK